MKNTDTAGTLAGVVSGKSGLTDLKPEQLAALGGSQDPIDTEDFSAADFGNEVTAPPSDEGDEGTDDKGDDADEGKDDADQDDDTTRESEDDGDADSADAEDAAGKAEDDAEGEDEDEPVEDADEDEGEDTDDEADDAEGEDEDEPPGKKDQRVPLERFRKVNARMREAERRLQEIEAELAASKGQDPDAEDADAPPPYDFEKAEVEYQDLLLDGQKEQAAAKRREIRAAERAEFKRETQQMSRETVDQSREAETLDLLAVKYEGLYPEMSKDDDGFMPEVLEEVDALMTGYVGQGLAPSKAFAKAVDRAAKNFGLKPAPERGDPPVKGDKAKGKSKAPDKKNADKNKVKVKDKLAKAKKAPPDTGKLGDRGEPTEQKSIEDMTDEEFAALPKSTLARMRGDTI